MTMNRVTNGAARPASRPQSDCCQIGDDERREDPADDRPADDRERRELEAAELDVGLEPLPPALAADRALRRVREHRGDLGAAEARLLFARHRDVRRHAAPKRAVADVDGGEDRERDERENRHDHEDHQPGRRDDLVDPGRLERALRREVERRGRVGRGRRSQPGAHRAHRRLDVRRENRAVADDVLVRELLTDRREDGLELLRASRSRRTCRSCRFATRPERLGVVLGRLQADRDDADVGGVQSGDRVSSHVPGRSDDGRPREARRSCGRSPPPRPGATPR